MTAVGKFNPNSTIKEYVQDLRAAQLSPTSESDKVCIQIANILQREEYLAWVDAGPESNAEFLKYAQDKLNALTKHPDTTLREIANNLGVTAVHCDGWDLQDDTELAAAVRAVHGEAPEPNEINWNNRVIFDVDEIGKNIQARSAQLKAEIDARQKAAAERYNNSHPYSRR